MDISANEYWNDVFGKAQLATNQGTSSWLEKHKNMLCNKPLCRVLEIGCGSGKDTTFLVNSGFEVTATDFSEKAIAILRQQQPNVQSLLHNTKNKFPFEANSFDIIVASLSLHYFDQKTTKQILQEIKRMLQVEGMLFVRLNSVNDEDAKKEHPIERYFYSVESCRELFVDWHEVSLQEYPEVYYGRVKVIVEGVFRREAVIADKLENDI